MSVSFAIRHRRMTTSFAPLLLGGDLRKLKNIQRVIEAVYDQNSFDELFQLVFHNERTLVMRAVDAVEKITRTQPEYLLPHKEQLLNIMNSADHKELKWHIAQLIPRLQLTREESQSVWKRLSYWAQNPNESKIVRANALQGMFDLARLIAGYRDEFIALIDRLSHEPIPSLQARIRRIRLKLG